VKLHKSAFGFGETPKHLAPRRTRKPPVVATPTRGERLSVTLRAAMVRESLLATPPDALR
jgi:hypothetical protein